MKMYYFLQNLPLYSNCWHSLDKLSKPSFSMHMVNVPFDIWLFIVYILNYLRQSNKLSVNVKYVSKYCTLFLIIHLLVFSTNCTFTMWPKTQQGPSTLNWQPLYHFWQILSVRAKIFWADNTRSTDQQPDKRHTKYLR